LKKPINEMGVVALFSQYAQGLGYVIMEIQAPFPDATLYAIETGTLVLAEIEFMASNFRKHGHDEDGCDLVICWENDWPDCPLPVLELKDVHDREPVETVFELRGKAEELQQAVDELDRALQGKGGPIVTERRGLIRQLKAADAENTALRKLLGELNNQSGPGPWERALRVVYCDNCRLPLAPLTVEEGRTMALVSQAAISKGVLTCSCGASKEFFSRPMRAVGLDS